MKPTKKGPTQFQRRVYELVQGIPRGRVTTYKTVAEALGCGSCQAIGQALRRNPYAPRVPCHRVIAADLTLGGFRGTTEGSSMAAKENMLALEGVEFKNGKLADPDRLITKLRIPDTGVGKS